MYISSHCNKYDFSQLTFKNVTKVIKLFGKTTIDGQLEKAGYSLYFLPTVAFIFRIYTAVVLISGC